jgi:hypothetical protein
MIKPPSTKKIRESPIIKRHPNRVLNIPERQMPIPNINPKQMFSSISQSPS